MVQTLSRNVELRREIEAAIAELGDEFRGHRALLLTEADLKCRLFQKLSSIPNLAGYHQTLDQGTSGSMVHAELPWFDERKKLAIRPDISIIDPNALSIVRSVCGARLPSKRFSFGGDALIFELKLCRWKSGITPHFFKQIKNDFNKIHRLFQKLNREGSGSSIYCFFVIFVRESGVCPEFQEFLQHHRIGQRHNYYVTLSSDSGPTNNWL